MSPHDDEDSEEEDSEEEEEEEDDTPSWILGFAGIRALAVNVLKYPVTDDSFIHQINCRYCVVIFSVFAIIVGIRHFVGKTIKCWCPAELKRFQVDYVDSYCWVWNTYHVPFDGTIPEKYRDREDSEISYYQWVPIILIFQAFLFYFPRMLWKTLSGHSGINMKKAILMADNASYASPEEQRYQVLNLVSYLDKWIEVRDRILSNPKRDRGVIVKEKLHDLGIKRSNLLTFIFIITGVLFAVNSVSQIFILDLMLDNDFKTIGLDFTSGVVKGEKWDSISRFPRITFCDLNIRQLQNVQKWTVQCSLPINLFNEYIFLTIWFLLILMSAMNFTYVMYNIYMFKFSTWRHDYVRKYLTLNDPEKFVSSKTEEKFVEKYLKLDGVFVLWLLGQNSNQIITSEIIAEMWNNFCERQR